MALVTHQMQGSYATFPSRRGSWNEGIELKRFVTTLHTGVKTDRFFSLRCKSCLSVGSPLVQGPKTKSLRISAFKGIAQNDESGSRASGSKSNKDSIKLSYVQQGSEDLAESSKMQDLQLSYSSEADDKIAASLAIQNLFKKWLTLLRTQPANQMVDGSLEGLDSGKILITENGTQKKQRGKLLKAVWCYFWGLDATVKIPLLIFIPWFLAVNVIYGAEVSKELSPLWVLGPLIVALYIKALRGLFALYVFSFKQTIKVVKNLPAYYLAAYSYFARGKLKEHVHAYLWQPLADVKNLDYRELAKRKIKVLEVWAVEKYLDYVESIWPYYCRTIRFLKRANLI
ncbi:hypothetical protein U1Q18_027379 [Sarracenia purpurea var. burkii]